MICCVMMAIIMRLPPADDARVLFSSRLQMRIKPCYSPSNTHRTEKVTAALRTNTKLATSVRRRFILKRRNGEYLLLLLSRFRRCAAFLRGGHDSATAGRKCPFPGRRCEKGKLHREVRRCGTKERRSRKRRESRCEIASVGGTRCSG